MDNINCLMKTDQDPIVVESMDIPAESIRMGMVVFAAGLILLILPFFRKYFSTRFQLGPITH